MSITEFTVVLENIPGKLADVAHRMGYAGINIRGISVTDKEDFSILRLVVNDPVAAERVFRESGIQYSIGQVLAVELPNIPGTLSECAKVLTDEQINIDYLYPFIARTVNAIIIIKTANNQKSEEAFKNRKIKMLSEPELYSIE